MTQVATAILLAVFFGLPFFLGYWFIIRPMRQEARGLNNFARSMRRMRDEGRASGADFKTTAELGRTMLGTDKK